MKHHDHGKTLCLIMEKLRESRKYNVHERVLNTAQNGVPQNRPRIYIVGILKDVDTGKFEWPKDIPCCSASSLLDSRDQELACVGLPNKEAATANQNVREFTKALIGKGVAPHLDNYFIACDADPKRSKCWLGQSPCLLSSKSKGYWITSRGRRMRPEEQMRFQGMDPTSFKTEVSEPELQRQIGNAMSLCVIERLLNRLIPAAGLANKAKVDRWESGDAVRGLEESRDGTFQRPGRPDVISEKPIMGELGEIHFWNKNPVFRYYRLPNRWT